MHAHQTATVSSQMVKANWLRLGADLYGFAKVAIVNCEAPEEGWANPDSGEWETQDGEGLCGSIGVPADYPRFWIFKHCPKVSSRPTLLACCAPLGTVDDLGSVGSAGR